MTNQEVIEEFKQKVIKLIEEIIDETRENGKHHAYFVQQNGEKLISGLELAIDAIEEISNEYKKH